MHCRHMLALSLLALAAARVAVAQDSTSHKLPFSRAEDADGARFVAFVMVQAGLPSVYVAAKDFPSSGDYRQVPADSARDGDVAWWQDFVAIYAASDQKLITPDGPLRVDSLTVQKGKPRFYRRLVPK